MRYLFKKLAVSKKLKRETFYFKKTLLFTPAKGYPKCFEIFERKSEAIRGPVSVLKESVSTGVAILRVNNGSARPSEPSTRRLRQKKNINYSKCSEEQHKTHPFGARWILEPPSAENGAGRSLKRYPEIQLGDAARTGTVILFEKNDLVSFLVQANS